MWPNKAEAVPSYVLKENPSQGFYLAKQHMKAKEYELAKQLVSEYLQVDKRDPKAHSLLGQLFEIEGDVQKAVACYKRSLDLNPAQKDLVLKVAELLCGMEESDKKAEVWVEKAAKLLPGNPAVLNLKEKLLGRQSQQGSNRLFDVLQAELAERPSDTHVNVKLVQLFTRDGRLDEAVQYCLDVLKRGQLRNSLDWYTVVVQTLQEYLAHSSVANSDKMCRRLQRELLLSHSSVLRLQLSASGVQPSMDALKSFDQAMQSLSAMAGRPSDELCEMFCEMRGHLYLQAGTLLLKMAQEGEKPWRVVKDLAMLCFLVAYQVPRPKAKVSKRDHSPARLPELLASERQSQAGHMLLNLNSGTCTFIREVVEAFGNRGGQASLFELLFGCQGSSGTSFIANDNLGYISTNVPALYDLAKWDSGSVLLHGGDLQHLTWMGIHWALLAQRPALQDWLKQLFPSLSLETSEPSTNLPHSICLLDLEVFVCGVVFCCQSQLQESTQCGSEFQERDKPRCLPLPLLHIHPSNRQREWWDAVYSLIHNQALPGMSAKLKMIVQHGLNVLRAGEKHGLQPALLVHWAQHLSHMGMGVNMHSDQIEYLSRSVHYWKTLLTLLDYVKTRHSIPEPGDPLFSHFSSRDIQLSTVKSYEEEAMIAFASLLDIEGDSEEAIATLETTNTVSSAWHLAWIYQRLSEEAGNKVKESQDRCFTFLRKFRNSLVKIYNANDGIEKLPVSREEVMDLLKEVNQYLEEVGETTEDEEEREGGRRGHSIPDTAIISPINFCSTSPHKSVIPYRMKHPISVKTPPHWVEEHKTLIQMFCRQVEALKIELHDMRQSTSANMGSHHHSLHGKSYSSEDMPEPYTPVPSIHAQPLSAATTGPSVSYNQSHNAQALAEVPEVPTSESSAAARSTSSTELKLNSNFQSTDRMPPKKAVTFGTCDILQFDQNSPVSLKVEGPQSKVGTSRASSFFSSSPILGSCLKLRSRDNSKGIFVTDTQSPALAPAPRFPENKVDQHTEEHSTPSAGEDDRNHNPPITGTPKATSADSTNMVKSSKNEPNEPVVEDEDGPQFEPIVPLPDLVEVKTEEEEEVLFCNRAKLFRFDTEANEWKERGIGDVKILKHNTSGKVRLLMRRKQVLKVCANHYIYSDMLLIPNVVSEKCWVWNAMDYADEQPKPEHLAIRFKTEEEAAFFKTKFEENSKTMPISPLKQDQSDQQGQWDQRDQQDQQAQQGQLDQQGHKDQQDQQAQHNSPMPLPLASTHLECSPLMTKPKTQVKMRLQRFKPLLAKWRRSRK